jgi:hypothetical protein
VGSVSSLSDFEEAQRLEADPTEHFNKLIALIIDPRRAQSVGER